MSKAVEFEEVLIMIMIKIMVKAQGFDMQHVDRSISKVTLTL